VCKDFGLNVNLDKFVVMKINLNTEGMEKINVITMKSRKWQFFHTYEIKVINGNVNKEITKKNKKCRKGLPIREWHTLEMGSA
jgi:nucleosome binding factor SPN SPT16 subunit